MPRYVAGYFGGGRRFNPFASDSPATKRRRLDFIEGVLTAAGQSEAAGALESINDSLSGPQLAPRLPEHLLEAAPSLAGARGSRTQMARSGRRRWRRRRRKTFKGKVGSALLAFKETHRHLDPIAQSTLSSGDGTTRVLYIANPVAQIFQDVGASDSTGDALWLKAMWFRGRISLDQTTNSLRVRILLVKSQFFADLPAGLTVYGNTTTALTNPTQDPEQKEGNVRIFETSNAEEAAQPSAPYVGNASGIDIIDKQYVSVLGGREYFLSQQHLLNFINVDIYVPINRKWKQVSDFGIADTDQNRSFTHGNYYWIIQIFSNSNANNILSAQDILLTADIVTYFKNLS